MSDDTRYISAEYTNGYRDGLARADALIAAADSLAEAVQNGTRQDQIEALTRWREIQACRRSDTGAMSAE